MNKVSVLLLMLAGSIVISGAVFAQDKQDGSENTKTVKHKRSFHYNPDGSLDSITYIFDDAPSYKNIYDVKERLIQKVYQDGREINYEYSNEGETKIITETDSLDGSKIMRKLNKKGEVIESVYPAGRTEKYSYVYNEIGDIEKIKVKNSDGTEEELSPNDKRMIFLNDYGIIEDDVNQFKYFRDQEYLYNPKKYREKLMMHKRKHDGIQD